MRFQDAVASCFKFDEHSKYCLDRAQKILKLIAEIDASISFGPSLDSIAFVQ